MSNGYSGYYKSFSLIAMCAFSLDTSHYILVSLISILPPDSRISKKKSCLVNPNIRKFQLTSRY